MSDIKILTVVPARMGSSRFPGKPLHKIHGKELVAHVYDNVEGANIAGDVYIATCDREIYDFSVNTGRKVVMTASSHERASDRCAEALGHIEKIEDKVYDIVILLQGDEPMTTVEMLDTAVQPMVNDPNIPVVNLYSDITTPDEFNDPNCIKVVCNKDDDALYFSRSAIPHGLVESGGSARKQVCVIPFRRNVLLDYIELPASSNELAESVDMMRLIDNGIPVRMIHTEAKSHAVDCLADVSIVEALMAKDL